MSNSEIRTSKFFLIAAIILLFAHFNFGQTVNESPEKQVDRLFSRYNQATSGVAVAIIKDGKIIFKKGYGTANLEFDIPITTKTVFNIASVSKQFTAFAIYLLETEGKISLEDDVRKYIAEIPDYGKTIKIKHLLAHTGGVKDQGALMSLAGWRDGDVTTMQDSLRLISRQKELNFEPGSRYLYSNAGYILLAEIVKRASGQTFGEFTRKNIFEPLEMNDTQFYDDYERIVKNRADSYELENGVYKKKILSNSADGAGNLNTTVEDMAKWALNFENPKVGDAELIKRFNEPSLLNNGEKVVYARFGDDVGYHAKGQIHWNNGGLRQISHGGHAAAFRSTFWRFPDQRFAFVLLSNDEHFEQAKNGQAIVDLYLKDLLKPKQNVNSTAPNPNKAVEKPNADLKDFEGRFYSEELDAAYFIKTINGKLFLSHIRHGEIELTDAGKDKFTGRIGFPAELEFIRDKNVKIIELRISNWGAKNVRFRKTNSF